MARSLLSDDDLYSISGNCERASVRMVAHESHRSTDARISQDRLCIRISRSPLDLLLATRIRIRTAAEESKSNGRLLRTYTARIRISMDRGAVAAHPRVNATCMKPDIPPRSENGSYI